MKIITVLLILINLSTILAQSESQKTVKHDLKEISGTWVIDLRPSPESDPYFKDFVIKYRDDKNFSGVFYDTEFENGKLNSNWDKIYFAFSTSDGNSFYYHSGYIDGESINGITYSPERNFTMPWRGNRK